jgi:ribonucrease Y
METVFALIAGVLLGVLGGYFFVGRKKALEIEAETERRVRESEKLIAENEKRSFEIERRNRETEIEGRDKAKKIIDDAQEDIRNQKQEIEKQEARLEEKEKILDEKVLEVGRQKNLFEEKVSGLADKEKSIDEVLEKEQGELERISGLKKEEAKEVLFQKIEQVAAGDLARKMRIMEDRTKTELEEKARNTIVQAVQRIASDVTSETTISVVELESDDLKGRIIGKEGRNINAFERTTGVNIVIDDTPGVVIISSFDPMRRFIAKGTIEELLVDGRIHPARIQEVFQKKIEETDKLIQDAGEKAVFETGVIGIPSDLVKILGRLMFRTSYGQNVLRHSIEVAFIAEALAYELGADPEISKKAGLLHDIGKTLSHEIGGKHAVLSGDLARKCGIDKSVVHAIEAHHEDVPIESVEAYIIQASDAISASRPGARRETTEKFIKRMMELEGIATSYKGVEKCYAMQAGREMWIFVNPEEISDLEASKLSWDITRRIESDVQYPGEVKVVMIRESRFIHTAK